MKIEPKKMFIFTEEEKELISKFNEFCNHVYIQCKNDEALTQFEDAINSITGDYVCIDDFVKIVNNLNDIANS